MGILHIMRSGSYAYAQVCVVEEVHPGSDRTSRSVARNQVPRHKSIF